MGEMNWKKLIPSKKDEVVSKKVIETTLISEDNDEEVQEKQIKSSARPSARSAAKKMRPKKMKK